MSLLTLRYTDAPTASLEYLLHDNIRNARGWIRHDAVLVKQVLARGLENTCLVPAGVDRRGAERRSVTVVRQSLSAETFGQVQGADLADAVVHEAGSGDERRHGCDGYHVSLPLGKHARHEGADEYKMREEVDLEKSLGLGIAGLLLLDTAGEKVSFYCRTYIKYRLANTDASVIY